MQIPRYWAEARVQRRRSGRQVTVRRFGWSDQSAADAERHAKSRAEEAFERAWSGEKVRRREPKVPYNGAEGLPIREEIIAEHGSTIITRNAYGALCLNTPDVLFADIDHPTENIGLGIGCVVSAITLAVAIGVGVAYGTLFAILLGLAVAPFAVWITLWGLSQTAHTWRQLQGGLESIVLQRIERLAELNRDCQLRVYRTPAGLRVLAMHDVFDPTGEEAQRLFADLNGDPVYAAMCRRQACFRARVSPKPWRVGIERHLKPQPGVWPIAAERMPERGAWTERYEEASRNYAACEYLTTLGTGPTHAAAREVQELHDRLCGATSGLPIA